MPGQFMKILMAQQDVLKTVDDIADQAEQILNRLEQSPRNDEGLEYLRSNLVKFFVVRLSSEDGGNLIEEENLEARAREDSQKLMECVATIPFEELINKQGGELAKAGHEIRALFGRANAIASGTNADRAWPKARFEQAFKDFEDFGEHNMLFTLDGASLDYYFSLAAALGIAELKSVSRLGGWPFGNLRNILLLALEYSSGAETLGVPFWARATNSLANVVEQSLEAFRMMKGVFKMIVTVGRIVEWLREQRVASTWI
ncbi:hypothetical protein PT974_00784 [Cladobotryum mycophilum]|uniref:Uncharacterized protein n=1 Tax=Cladobotryum mycophilum TaxID=491253 RepID=A0ABR0T332_9HYPO